MPPFLRRRISAWGAPQPASREKPTHPTGLTTYRIGPTATQSTRTTHPTAPHRSTYLRSADHLLRRHESGPDIWRQTRRASTRPLQNGAIVPSQTIPRTNRSTSESHSQRALRRVPPDCNNGGWRGTRPRGSTSGLHLEPGPEKPSIDKGA